MINFICVSCSCLPIILHSINIAEIENKSIETLWKDCTCILIGVLIMFFFDLVFIACETQNGKRELFKYSKTNNDYDFEHFGPGLGFYKNCSTSNKIKLDNFIGANSNKYSNSNQYSFSNTDNNILTNYHCNYSHN